MKVRIAMLRDYDAGAFTVSELVARYGSGVVYLLDRVDITAAGSRPAYARTTRQRQLVDRPAQ